MASSGDEGGRDSSRLSLCYDTGTGNLQVLVGESLGWTVSVHLPGVQGRVKRGRAVDGRTGEVRPQFRLGLDTRVFVGRGTGWVFHYGFSGWATPDPRFSTSRRRMRSGRSDRTLPDLFLSDPRLPSLRLRVFSCVTGPVHPPPSTSVTPSHRVLHEGNDRVTRVQGTSRSGTPVEPWVGGLGEVWEVNH